ncbi:hypothetical protein [Chitinophaga nivalis]|uniref:DUF928 domain-containing protein n=1 Tax=Chitinophaga nivalis TaxID=2991709 RepID=A0ABT3IRP7_9BACT|nr:hypothetical protein [Chitinophaga nivalis]MCW3463662.1 hypothetical protein [Chitinophaga nivalis]MCW3486648.1 hypothetical protein [Chitinophaga nivalis]
MKKITTLFMTLLACVLYPVIAGAQVSMAVQLPPAGVLQKAQLWNIMLVNAATRNLDVRIMLRLTDAVSSEAILTAVSGSVTLSTGGRQLQAKDVAPVQYEYLSPAADRRENGLLSPGSYIACYSVVIDGDKTDLPVAEDCIPFTVEPVSPPLLNMPSDSAVLETRLPQFTWIPPAPITQFADLNYELIVAEVRENQSATEAIQQNIPVYRATGLRNIFLAYPSGGYALDSSKTYAWMVNANNGRQFAAQTEVWTFTLKKNISNTPDGSPYIQLKQEADGVFSNCGNILKCAYNNEAGEETVKYEVINLSSGNARMFTGSFTLQPGSNLLEVPLDHHRGLKSDVNYCILLHNGRGETWRLNFRYHPAEQQ